MFADGLNEILKFKESGPADELSEGQLDDVAGGGFINGTLRLAASSVAAFGYGALCGICPAACAGSPYVAVGLSAWTTAGYVKKAGKIQLLLYSLLTVVLPDMGEDGDCVSPSSSFYE